MKRLALVFPRFRYPSGDPPLGVGYLAAAVRSWTDWQVDIIDTTFYRDPAREMEERIRKGAYDVVGVSYMTPMIRGASLAAAAAKRANPRTIVVAGGPHPTVASEHAMSDPNFDVAVLGEGEVTLAELLKRGGDPAGVDGTVRRSKDGLVREKPRLPVPDLDSLPFPAFDLYDMESYYASWFLFDTVAPGVKGTSLLTSRGCPYHCTYCQPTLETLFGRRIRKRSPENVVKELRELREKHGVTAFTLQDDTFLIDKQWVRDLSLALEKSGLGMLFECNIRANLADPELLALLKNAGLRKVNLGIESATQRILDDIFQKGITWEQVERTVETSKKLGLRIQGYFMLGSPTETRKEVLKTIASASRLGLDEATFTITTPLPHTTLYERTADLIDRDFESFDYYSTSVYKPGVTLSPRLLFWLKRWAFIRFYLGPRKIWKTLGQVLDPRNISKTIAKLARL